MKVGLFINTQFPEGFNLTDRVLEMIAQVPVCSLPITDAESLLESLARVR